MPTRVLYTDPGGSVIRLSLPRDAKPEDGRYVALSHCWGYGGTPFATTRSTLQRRMEGIDFQELPKTFRDAVNIVRSLGLRHLWIDSLCIIQQDPDDWAAESAKMANVYHDAYLILGATSSPSDSLGFLGPRDLQDIVYLPLKTSASLCLQLLRPGSHRWTSSNGYGPDPLVSEPLTARAWCLQERYLAMRCLQYGSQQMFWECGNRRLVKTAMSSPMLLAI